MKLVDKIIAQINANEVAESTYDADCLRCSALQTMRKWIDIDGVYQYAKNHDVLVDGSAEAFACEFFAAYNNEVAYTY
jgi:uncharacterized protein (DUF2267 family)